MAGAKAASAPELKLAEFDAEQSGEEAQWRGADERRCGDVCPDCAGERLNPVARHVLFRGRSIAALTRLPVQEFADTVAQISSCAAASSTSPATCSRS